LKGSKKKLRKQLKKETTRLVKKSTVKANGLDFVTVDFEDDNFTLIGCGCSSAVFRSKKFPDVAVKVYSPEYRDEVFLETLAYKKVRDLKYFPRLHFYGRYFLAIDYIEGKSLYDCLIEGIEIPDDIVRQVDEAINLAKGRGLVPSDVHFKNIILNGDMISLIDLSDYLSAKHVTRWDRLKFFYKTVYKPMLKGIRVPKKLVDFFRKAYKYVEKALNRVIK